jgi:divalent metal cation (Fe/Co/Zn/Cd) transporter
MATDVTHRALVVRGLRLEYVTLAWNALEAAVAIIAGLVAGSIALVGFGLDPVIECLSGGALLWRLRAEDGQSERRERIALKLVGMSFLLLAAYVGIDAAHALVVGEHPEHSIPGIVLSCLSLIVMPLLARAKRRVAAALSSGALHADSRQTDICAYLSGILVGGLVLNAVWNWWWADPIAALVMTPIIAREGIEALRGNSCACASTVAPGRMPVTCGCTGSEKEDTHPACRG